jgi:hypothetical protein
MRKFSFLFLLTTLLLGNFAVAGAQTAQENDLEKLTAFQAFKTIENLNITVPTVIEIPFDEDEKVGYDLAVLENTTQEFQPWILKSERERVKISAEEEALTDGNTLTYVEYEVPTEGSGTLEIILSAEQTIKSSSLTLSLDRYVALPTYIILKVQNGEEEKTVLNRTKMESTLITFPETEAKEWILQLEYTQLLRINEIELQQETEGETQAIRFLAQPETAYTVYFNADRPVNIETGESGNLTKDDGVKILDPIASQENEQYQKEDSDDDGIPDKEDNCVSVANTEQTDEDGNDRGDECDDYDRDGTINGKDNCVNEPNANQADEDGDGIGNTCDSEESRFTEKYPWLPWLGIGVAGAVVLFLFYKTAKEE